MLLMLFSLTSGSLLLLAFITFINPKKVNTAANHWLAFLLFSAACAIISPMVADDTVVRLLELSRFAIAPALYLSVLYFTSPGRKFKRIELLHFLPFLLFAVFAQTFIIPISFKNMLEQ